MEASRRPWTSIGTVVDVAVGDLDRDGDPDLVAVSNTGSLGIMLGVAGGGFSAPTPYSVELNPQAVVIADFNRDDVQDVAVANAGGATGTVSVRLGAGNGSFGPEAAYPTGTGPWAIAAADLNEDGWPDIVTANINNNNVGALWRSRWGVRCAYARRRRRFG